MSDSPTVSSLQQLLARPAPPLPFSAHSITSPSSSAPRRSSPPTTTAGNACTSEEVSAPSPRSGWASTISSAFGYGAAPSPAPAAAGSSSSATFAAGGQRARARERRRIPAWGSTVHEVPLGEGEAFDESAAALEEDDDGEMDSLVESILWQAGHDQLDPPGPLLVIAGSRLPPSTEIPHAVLLAKLRRRLETFAQAGPYTVALLVNPTTHAPTTANLVSSYLSVARTVRKNVRHIYVTGGGWWTRAILGIFSSTLLSAKSAEKLVQCATLSSLAQAVGAAAFRQVEFPLEVYVANAAVEKEIVMTSQEGESLGAVFGRPLEQVYLQLMGEEQAGHQLPAVVRDCVDVLLEQGPRSVGIFRRSPSAAHVAHLRGAYDRGHPVSLSTLPDAAYLAASLLKLYLRELPAPLFPRGDLWNVSRACPVDDDDAALAHVRAELLPLFSPPVCTLLQHVLGVLAAVAADSDDNLMTSSNLVVCMCPALIGGLGDVPTMEEIEMCRVTGGNGTATIKHPGGATSGRENTVGGILRIMIERYAEIFPPSSPVAVKPDQQIDSAPTASSLTPPSPSTSSSCADVGRAAPHPASLPPASRSRSASPQLFSSPPPFAHRHSPLSRRDVHGTIKIKKPARGAAKGGAGFLVEAFREEKDEEDVQRVEAHGQLVSPRRREAGWAQSDEGSMDGDEQIALSPSGREESGRCGP